MGQAWPRMRRGRLAEEADVLEECAVTPNIVTQIQSHSSGDEAAASSPFWRYEEEADVLEMCALSSAETPNIVALLQYLASCSAHSGAECAAPSAFYSARIEGLRELRSKVNNQLEFDVESSKSQCRRGLAEEGDLLEECASSRAETPSIITSMQSVSSCSGHSGAEAAHGSAFYSARIEGLRELRSKVDNRLEFDVESSISHWTELSAATDDSDNQVPNSVVFEKLKEHPEWGLFFQGKQYELEIGAKIAEGGQAEIFEAIWKKKCDAGYLKQARTSLVLKVFREGYSLIDLQRSWPPGIAFAAYPHQFSKNRFQMGQQSGDVCWAMGLHLMDNGRFAFIFERHWGDLRKLIDEKMLEKSGMECPPFDAYTTVKYILSIAKGMYRLHELGILHNDLKASNVLVLHKHSEDVAIADFESSKGIAGTGFWRAPEVLLALKNGNSSREPFTEKSDVYSFAMTCYELLTGCMPFEGHDRRDFDIVLRGERPKLSTLFLFLCSTLW